MQRLRVTVTAASARYLLEEGDPREIMHHGTKVTLQAGQLKECPIPETPARPPAGPAARPGPDRAARRARHLTMPKEPGPGPGEHQERAERGDPELTALRQAWQEGQPLSAPGLTVAADGALLLRPSGSRPAVVRQGAARVAVLALLVTVLGLYVLGNALVVTAAVAAGAG